MRSHQSIGNFLPATTLLTCATIASVSLVAAPATAASFRVQSGFTSVLLDTELLQSAANLTLTGATNADPVVDGFTASFAITPESDFSFDTTAEGLDFGSITGAIAHTGSVEFNDAIEVGNFDIGFDAARANGTASGFFVRSTLENDFAGAILFDIGNPGTLNFDGSNLEIANANLLVSPEFAGVLQSVGLATADLTGADVGDALTRATTISAEAVPEPTTALGIMGAGMILALRRRKAQ